MARPALRLGFDAARALHNSTGLGSYARGVLRGLAEVGGSELHLYTRRAPHRSFETLPQELGATLHLPPPGWRGAGLRDWWRTFRIGRTAAADGIDLYHGLTQELPRDIVRAGIPAVVTVADLLYVTEPRLFPAIDRISYRWRYRWSARNAAAVIAISSHTRDQLHRHFGVPMDRIAVIPPAVDPEFTRAISADRLAAARRRHELPDRYFIAVGTLEPRKRQVAAVRAIAASALSGITLVLVGADGGSRKALVTAASRLGVSERVRFATDVDSADLVALVSGAIAALYLSSAEGFGMPIVEAMAAGVPVIAASGAHLSDAGGSAARYVDPDDTETLASVMVRLAQEPGLRQEATVNGLSHARGFDRAVLARRLVSVYDAVLQGRPLPAWDGPTLDNPDPQPTTEPV